MWARFLLTGLLVVAPTNISAEQGRQHKVCISRFRANCPSGMDGFYRCPQSRTQVAQQVCVVYNGSVAVSIPYSIVQILPEPPQGACGVDAFIVFCHTP